MAWCSLAPAAGPSARPDGRPGAMTWRFCARRTEGLPPLLALSSRTDGCVKVNTSCVMAWRFVRPTDVRPALLLDLAVLPGLHRRLQRLLRGIWQGVARATTGAPARRRASLGRTRQPAMSSPHPRWARGPRYRPPTRHPQRAPCCIASEQLLLLCELLRAGTPGRKDQWLSERLCRTNRATPGSLVNLCPSPALCCSTCKVVTAAHEQQL